MSAWWGAAPKPLIAVTGSERPYIYDLPHMLSLPAGFEFRFRYRHPWVESALGDVIASKPAALRGRTLIVVFHSAGKQRLLPVRRCRIVDVEALGPVIYLRFRVEEFIRTPSGATTLGPVPAEDAWEALHKLAKEMLGAEIDEKDLAKPLGNGFYLRESRCDDLPSRWSAEKAAKAANAWALLAQVLGEESNLWGVPMFYLLGFQRDNGRYAPARRLWLRGASVPGWCRPRVTANKLVEGQRYRLRVLEWCKPKDDNPIAVNVSCKFDERMLQLESSASLVVGKYDILEFSVLAKRPAFGQFELRADPEKSQTPPDWPRLFAARVPIRVRQSWPRMIFVAGSFLAGVACYHWGAWLAANASLPESLWHLLGTFLIFVSLGEFVDRFVKLGKDLRDYAQPPSTPKQ